MRFASSRAKRKQLRGVRRLHCVVFQFLLRRALRYRRLPIIERRLSVRVDQRAVSVLPHAVFVLRLGGGSVLASYGLWGGAGTTALFSGGVDLAIGLIYLIGLPRHLKVSALNLLLDRTHTS